MSVMPAHPYHPAAAPYDWTFFQSTYGFPYEFTRSPNTSSSGGSDESMNQGPNGRIDPKKNPKYLEKRAKNNEAARKSRLQRKQRENGYQQENEILKKRVNDLEKEKDALAKIAKDAIEHNECLKQHNEQLKRQLAAYQQQQPIPFRDVSNMAPPPNISLKYQSL